MRMRTEFRLRTYVRTYVRLYDDVMAPRRANGGARRSLSSFGADLVAL